MVTSGDPVLTGLDGLVAAGVDINAVNKRGESPLARAVVQQASLAQIDALVKAGADIHCKNSSGDGLIAQAMYSPEFSQSLVLKLIDLGLSVNDTDRMGRTALWRIAYSGNPEDFTLLIERGLDVNAQDSGGNTALFAAADSRNPEAARVLLAAGANANHVNERKETPLLRALTGNPNPAVYRMLLEAGANPNWSIPAADAGTDTKASTNAFGNILWRGLFGLLSERAADSDVLANAWSPVRLPLEAALYRQDGMEAFHSLVEAGADVKAPTNQFGDTLLHRLFGRDPNLADVKRLLAYGIDPNAKNSSGRTALMQGAHHLSPDLVAVMADAGADLNAKDTKGFTVLMLTVVKPGLPVTVQALLDKGADVNALSWDGNSALMLAVREQNADLARLLIAAGADVNQKNHYGHTLLETMLQSGNADLHKLGLEVAAGSEGQAAGSGGHAGNEGQGSGK